MLIYKNVTIPDPFPVQKIGYQAEPIRPFIFLGEGKVLAVRDQGGLCMESWVEWGSLKINARGQVHTLSFDPSDPMVKELEAHGLLSCG